MGFHGRHRHHLNLRAGLDDIGGSLIGVLLEVLVEKDAELLDLALEVSSTRPALGRVKKLVRDVGAGLWHLEVEGLVGLVLDLCQLSAVDGVEDGTGVLERAALATGGSTSTDPAGVEQPGICLVLLDLACQHLCVTHGVKGEERLGKAGGEGGLRLSDALLSTGHLGGVTANEVEHGLLSVEL